MTWSYNLPITTAKDEIRLLVGDTTNQRYSLQDEEIQYAVTLYSANPPVIGNNFLAAAVCAEMILPKLKAYFGNKSVADLSLGSNANTLQMFEDTARRLRTRAALKAVKTSFGGESYAEKQAAAENHDVPKTAAIIDGMSIFGPDSGEPSGGTGSETI